MNEDTPHNNETESDLKRCISRLSYIGMGLSTELDKALADLRNLIKNDEDEKKLKKSIDNISKVLRVMEDKSDPTPVEVITKEVNLLQLLLKQKLPKQLKTELKKAQRKKQSEKASDIASSIVIAIQSFLDSVEKSNTVKTEPKLGFFAKLFSVKQSANNQSEVKHPDISAIPEELKMSLQHLVDQLSAMETYSEIATKLTDKVNQLISVSQLSDVLELITGAFVKVSDLEHQQFEVFLKSLNKRIDRVNRFINSTVDYSQQVKKDSSLLDRDLKESVTAIKSSVEESNSYDEIKDTIYSKMDSIIKRVNVFYTQQESNQQKLNQNVEQLQQQLKLTEEESSRLRDDLAEQKARAQTDPLTQLPNRYSYNDQLTQEYNRWRRYRSPLSLVVADIDFFKKINDEYGHAAGDQVLKCLADFFKTELRESDFIARYGGEEFVILLPETTLVDSTKAINKLRLGVKELKVEFEEATIQIAMSFGLSEFAADDTPKSVFERADKALYRAKEKGRDQVCCQRAKSD